MTQNDLHDSLPEIDRARNDLWSTRAADDELEEEHVPEDDGCPYTLVDCDVHPLMAEGMASLRPFLSAAGRRRLGLDDRRALSGNAYREPVGIPRNQLFHNQAGVLRADATSPEGAAPGADPAHTARQLLDGVGVDRAVLIGGEVMGLGALPDPDNAALIAAAYNDWMAATWLAADARYRGTITVGARDPQQAAAEIRRSAADERFVAVLLPMTDVLLGERHFWPIYEAAAEAGLPVTVHPNSAEGVYRTGPAWPGGSPTYYVEWHTGLSQVFAANLVSLVCHGVFERFGDLKVVITEGGIGWLPDVLWRLDKNVRGLRDEVPWLRRLPSEYVADHVRFTTQPMPEPARRSHLHVLCEIVQAERTLMFSSDYPHWDYDDPKHALTSLPGPVRDRVRAANAMETYGSRL